MTTCWLLTLPGAHTTSIFQEGLAMVLCLPSPACSSRVGERIGGRRVDQFGDTLKREALAGNGWTIRNKPPQDGADEDYGIVRVVAT